MGCPPDHASGRQPRWSTPGTETAQPELQSSGSGSGKLPAARSDNLGIGRAAGLGSSSARALLPPRRGVRPAIDERIPASASRVLGNGRLQRLRPGALASPRGYERPEGHGVRRPRLAALPPSRLPTRRRNTSPGAARFHTSGMTRTARACLGSPRCHVLSSSRPAEPGRVLASRRRQPPGSNK